MVIETLVKTVLTELREMTKTETVVGKAMKVGDITVIPISKISVGFGVGGGRGSEKKTDGEATGGVVLGKVIDRVPQIIEKVKSYREKKAGPSEKDGKQKK